MGYTSIWITCSSFLGNLVIFHYKEHSCHLNKNKETFSSLAIWPRPSSTAKYRNSVSLFNYPSWFSWSVLVILPSKWENHIDCSVIFNKSKLHKWEVFPYYPVVEVLLASNDEPSLSASRASVSIPRAERAETADKMQSARQVIWFGLALHHSKLVGACHSWDKTGNGAQKQ